MHILIIFIVIAVILAVYFTVTSSSDKSSTKHGDLCDRFSRIEFEISRTESTMRDEFRRNREERHDSLKKINEQLQQVQKEILEIKTLLKEKRV